MSASPIRISDKLKTEVANAIDRVYGASMQAAMADKPDLGDTLYRLMYEPHFESMSRLPLEFFRHMDKLEVQKVDGLDITIDFKLSNKKLMGWKHPVSDSFKEGTYGDKITIYLTEETEEIVNTIKAWWDVRGGVVTTREASKKEVKRVMDSFKSLAPAIKMFPPLVELLPHDVRRKIDVPMDRLSSASMELNPVLKKLSTDLAVRKMMRY